MHTRLGHTCHALRYLYYCKATSLVPDHFYDLIEKLAIEKGDSTLGTPGSNREDSYLSTHKSLADLLEEIGTEQLMQSVIKNEKL